jgi:NDP-sugar pyrophosphorylase family protein
MLKNTQLLIPMSGMGKRFLDSGYKTPKPLIEIDGKPIIEHVLNLFPGVDDVTFICNDKHLKETNMREILTRIKPKSKILEVSYENRKGPVDAIKQIESFVDDEKHTLISYCDYGTLWEFDKFLEYIEKNDLDGAIPYYTGFHPHMLGTDNYAFCKHYDNFLIEIQEKKPFTENKMDEYASNGTYFFKKGSIMKKYFNEFLNSEYSLNGEFYVSMVFNLLVRDGLKVGLFEIENMLQWGTPYDLEMYRGWSEYFQNIDIENNKVKNPPNTTLILPMAGKGSRFVDKGYKKPKPLIDVDGLPMVVRAIECLPESDENLFMCLKEHIVDYNIDKELKKYYLNSKVVEIDDVTEGQACTCEIGINQANLDLEKPILISACDNGVQYDTEEYVKLIKDENLDIIVWSFRNDQSSKINPNSYAWLEVDENNFIKNVSCKKFIYDDPLKTHAIIGTMFFRKGKYFIDGLHKNYEKNIRTNNEFYVDDVLNQNIKMGLNVKVFEVKKYVCWGTPDDYNTYKYWQNFFKKCPWLQKNKK